jgi:hypothetical protein
VKIRAAIDRLDTWLAPTTAALAKICGPEPTDGSRPTHLAPRWIFLRALGAIYFSAFLSLDLQIHGLIGPHGLEPAGAALAHLHGSWLWRHWNVPTVLWLGAGDDALTALTAFGMLASALLVANVAPRAAAAVCWVLFLSWVSCGGDFASYQSDYMLLEAGFMSIWFAPRGLRPGLGEADPPSRACRYLLLWECFRIYFESGIVKIASHDPQWAHLTAMDHYYENGPLPTWIGWYVQEHLPLAFHHATAFFILALELALVWIMWIPVRRVRLVSFVVLTSMQAGIILTANYAFLNYLVLSLGILLLDDTMLRWPRRRARDQRAISTWRIWPLAFVQVWILYSTILRIPKFPVEDLPSAMMWPVKKLAPFGVADRYGLFASMTDARYELEFQGTRDGVTWTPYPFRCKPQAIDEAPGIYAPYQPRFEWNLWFASLDDWRRNVWVTQAEVELLRGNPAVLELFAANPFAQAPPRRVRVVRWQYWFTTPAERRATGAWWRRELVDVYTIVMERNDDGKIYPVADDPDDPPIPDWADGIWN